MAGERYLYAPAEAEAVRLAETVRTVEAGIEVEVETGGPAFDASHPVLIVYLGETPEDRMAGRLRDLTGWDVRTDHELESMVSARTA